MLSVALRGSTWGPRMRRREFIAFSMRAAVSWPLAVRAQQPEPVRRIGVLMHLEADDQEGQDRILAFRQGLQQLGWIDGHNMQVDIRWGGKDADRRRYASELIAHAPDVILASTTLAMVALQQTTSTVPIVFVNVTDPVGAGFVRSLAQPGGNVTGFTTFEFSGSAKWLELLKEVAPQIRRAVVIRDPTIASAVGQFAVIQSAAQTFGLEVSGTSERKPGPTAGLSPAASFTDIMSQGPGFRCASLNLALPLGGRQETPRFPMQSSAARQPGLWLQNAIAEGNCRANVPVLGMA